MPETPQQSLERLFRRRFGVLPESVALLQGDGSNRRIYRLVGGGSSAIGVFGPDQRENRAFLGFSRHFRGEGLPVPQIYEEDAALGTYVEEDFGDTTLFEHLTRGRGPRGPAPGTAAIYERALHWLPRFQFPGGRRLDYRLCYPRRSFDLQSMLWDLSYFKYYFLRLAKISFDEQALEDDFRRFAVHLLAADRGCFLYRDFQSRNIMARKGEPGFIDYQGGRRGAAQYDVASLLYDGKAALPEPFRRALLERYVEEASAVTRLDRKDFLKRFPGYIYIRIFQALGTYGLRGYYEKKQHFLQSIPPALDNIERLLGSQGLPVRLPALEKALRGLVRSPLRKSPAPAQGLSVRVRSFSYKGSIPEDDKGHGGGFVFDCRALPNPGRDESMAPLTGQHPRIARWLEREPSVRAFLNHAFGLVGQAVESYRARGFTDLLVSFGCTGGRHRSVYCAERLSQRLRESLGVAVELRHEGGGTSGP